MAAHKSIPWDLQPLGKVFDKPLARHLGCSPYSVKSARRVRGIPSAWTPKQCVSAERLVSPAVLRSVLAALGRCPIKLVEIRERVAYDIGLLSERQIYRAIRHLRQSGKIVRSDDPAGYRLAPR